MGKKKVLISIIILILIILIGLFIYKYLKSKKTDDFTEYTPEQEITDEQLRETIVNLYFLDKETQGLKIEPRLIDAADLLKNPYKVLVQLLIDGPKNESLEKVIPDGVEIYNAEVKNNIAILDMSDGLLCLNDNPELKQKVINSIVDTLTELTEVDKIKFLINGEENQNFNEVYAQLK